jgi:hypothetical protein
MMGSGLACILPPFADTNKKKRKDKNTWKILMM